jgi:hypothetical protein
MVALAARYALPAIYPVREFAAYLQHVTLWLNRALIPVSASPELRGNAGMSRIGRLQRACRRGSRAASASELPTSAPCRSMCGWIGNGILARAPIRPNSAWKAFGVIGASRSVMKTCEDAAPRIARPLLPSSSPAQCPR